MPAPEDIELNWTPIWKSKDMINWSGSHVIYMSDSEGIPHRASGGYHYNGMYYVETTRGNRRTRGKIAVFEADRPKGPYMLYTEYDQRKLGPGVFVDTDGSSYLLLDAFIAPLSEDWKRVGERSHRPYAKRVWEGPFLIKHNNRYHKFRARNKQESTAHQLMLGYSDHPLNEYTLREGNPVYDGNYRPGHGGYSTSPDGTHLWFVDLADLRGI